MKPLDLTTALARLLSDAALRDAFDREPAAVADRLPIRDADRDVLTSLDPDALQRQARTLLDKRFHEVRQLIPHTCDSLDCEAQSEFCRYAKQFWPAGHNRHAVDALAFCDFLCSTARGKHVCRSERNWLRFRFNQRRVAFHLVPDLLVKSRRRKAIQFLYRGTDGTPRQLGVYLNL